MQTPLAGGRLQAVSRPCPRGGSALLGWPPGTDDRSRVAHKSQTVKRDPSQRRSQKKASHGHRVVVHLASRNHEMLVRPGHNGGKQSVNPCSTYPAPALSQPAPTKGHTASSLTKAKPACSPRPKPETQSKNCACTQNQRLVQSQPPEFSTVKDSRTTA